MLSVVTDCNTGDSREFPPSAPLYSISYWLFLQAMAQLLAQRMYRLTLECPTLVLIAHF